MIQTRTLAATDSAAIQTAISILSGGGLIAFPTDTVYGLAAGLNSYDGIQRLYEAKARSASKAIAVLVGEVHQLDQVTTGLTASAARLAQAFWPGALTIVVPKHPDLPANLSPLATIGVRMPDHDFARQLMRAAGPLATTSANISGEANTLTAQAVLDQLDGRVEVILDGGAAPGGVPSTVVDCTMEPPQVLRQGAILAEQISEALRQV